MVQELISSIAIIGAGPAGCICAKFLQDFGFAVTLFDKGSFLRTILPTGGGRCNLAHAEYNFKELAKNYPRGEKFLYSLFSKFGTNEALEFFKQIGIKTYIQDDNRIFPTSNSAKEVREKLLNSISGCNFIKEEVIEISHLDSGYLVKSTKSKYLFDIVVVAQGGHANLQTLNKLDINIIKQTPALTGLKTSISYSELAGLSIKNVKIKIKKENHCGDILFTHKGISGPLIYKISSILARETMPYRLNMKFVEDFDLQADLNNNSKKEIKNLLSNYIPKSFANYLLKANNIEPNSPCHKITKDLRTKIYKNLTNYEIEIIDKIADSEIVTCGGVDLKEINAKTLESKKYPNLYFCGEILDIDGFCGGFNLQNCWTTGYIVAQAINTAIR